jgi:glycosyltransferase involved in cell wall biosynthesis
MAQRYPVAFELEEQPVTIRAEKRISVLHLIYSPGYGGIETMVLNWAKNFDTSAFDVHVAYFAGDRDRELPFLEAAKRAGITPLPVRWSRYKPFFKAARDVVKIVKDYGIDIVHTHAYYGDAVGAIAGHMVPVKTVATIYVWTSKYELHRQIMQFMDWVAIQFMDMVTGHCADTARHTYVIGKRASEIPVLLPGYPDAKAPVSAAERRKLREAAGIREDEIVMVNVARIAPEKAQDQLIRSFKIVHDKHPNTKLWISGVGLDWLEKDLRALRSELGLESSVEFLGFTKNVWEMLNTADFMVHASHAEGVPAAILEGMAAGMPIVASAVNGIPEVIASGRSGLLVDENDVTGFAKSVIDLIEDRAWASRMGRAARQSIENELSIRSAVSEVEKLYRRMLSE